MELVYLVEISDGKGTIVPILVQIFSVKAKIRIKLMHCREKGKTYSPFFNYNAGNIT